MSDLIPPLESHRGRSAPPGTAQRWSGQNVNDNASMHNGDRHYNTVNHIYGNDRGHSQPPPDNLAYQRLFNAARYGELSVIKHHINNLRVDIYYTDENGMTALHYASWYGHTDCVKFLLDAGATPNAGAGRGTGCGTPLCLAVLNNRVPVVKFLLQEGANVTIDAGCFGTPLHAACNGGSVDSLKLLLEKEKCITARGLVHPPLWNRYRLTQGSKLVVTNPDALRLYHDADAVDCQPLFTAAAMFNRDAISSLLSVQRYANSSASITTSPPSTSGAERVSALSLLARCGSVGALGVLLSFGADPNRLDINGDNWSTPITCAASLGRAQSVRSLVKHGANVNTKTKTGLSPVILASRAGHADTLQVLLELGAEMDDQEPSTGATAMCMSTEHVPCVEILLNKGAKVDQANHAGDTPVHIAAAKGHLKSLWLLLNRGARVNLLNKAQFVPLHSALTGKHPECVELLLQRGAISDVSGAVVERPIYMATRLSLPACISALAARGANINNVDQLRQTPLVKAVLQQDMECVRTLISLGADVNIADRDGKTALHHSAALGDTTILTKLLAANPDIEAQTHKDHFTPLHLAVQAGHNDIAARLVVSDAKLEAQTDEGGTALTMASRLGRLYMVRILLGEGADISHRNKFGNTAVLLAVRHAHPEVARFLIKSGADVNCYNNNGDTPLFCAIDRDDPDESMVRLLIDAGADVNWTRGRSRLSTARNLAMTKNVPNIVALLDAAQTKIDG